MLEGTVLKYDDPTLPVAENEWDVYTGVSNAKYKKGESNMVAPTLPHTGAIEVTDDYKLEIPPALAESLGFQPGQKLQAIFYAGRIEIVPEIDPRDARGSMPGLDKIVDPEENTE